MVHCMSISIIMVSSSYSVLRPNEMSTEVTPIRKNYLGARKKYVDAAYASQIIRGVARHVSSKHSMPQWPYKYPPDGHGRPSRARGKFLARQNLIGSGHGARVLKVTVRKCQTMKKSPLGVPGGFRPPASIRECCCVTIRKMFYGHYGIGCLLETCQATPLMIWEA